LATPADSARVASDPHRALEATGCHGLSSPSTLACARAATPTRVPVRTDEDAGSSSEEPAPKPRRPRTRDMYSRRTNALPNGSSHRRCRRRRPGAFVGWRPLTRKRAVRDPARRPWRRDAMFDPTRCSEPAPHEPCPKTEHVWRSPTDHRNRVTAPRPTRHSPGRAARRCCHLFAISATNRSPTHPAPEIAHDADDPKAIIARRNPRLGADAQWPPCGDPPTPELTHSPGHQHPTEQVARG
jgi:hypothetical protein